MPELRPALESTKVPPLQPRMAIVPLNCATFAIGCRALALSCAQGLEEEEEEEEQGQRERDRQTRKQTVYILPAFDMELFAHDRPCFFLFFICVPG